MEPPSSALCTLTSNRLYSQCLPVLALEQSPACHQLHEKQGCLYSRSHQMAKLRQQNLHIPAYFTQRFAVFVTKQEQLSIAGGKKSGKRQNVLRVQPSATEHRTMCLLWPFVSSPRSLTEKEKGTYMNGGETTRYSNSKKNKSLLDKLRGSL